MADGTVLAWVLGACLLVTAGSLVTTIRVRRAYVRAVEQRAARVDADRDRQAHLAVAAERTRIAREMHDIVAHNLSVMIALADGAAAMFDHAPDRARRAIGQVADTGRAALDQMRTTVSLLRADTDAEPDAPPTLTPEPRIADLETLLDSIRATGVQVTYRTSGPTDSLPPQVQLAAYRIVQEAITNTVKHAPRATRMLISIRRGQSDLRIVVDDNGGAPHPSATTTARADGTDPSDRRVGHGLIGMRERMALHNGRLLAGPTPTGWRVSAWLPLDIEQRRHLPRLIGHRT